MTATDRGPRDAGGRRGPAGQADATRHPNDTGGRLDFARIKADAAQHAETVCRRYLPDGKREGHDWVALSPFRPDNKPGSFRVDLRNGTFTDFATHDKGDLIDIVQCVSRHTAPDAAARELAAFLGTGAAGPARASKPSKPPPPPAVVPVPDGAPPLPERHRDLGEPSVRWTYRDAEGRTLFYVCRFQTPAGKEDRPLSLRRIGDKLEWRWLGLDAPRPLYRLPELAAAPDLPVLIVEGERSADAAARMLPGWVAVTSPGGSGGAAKADWQPLAGRRCVVWRDHDQPGEKYAAAVHRHALAAGAVSVAVASLEPLAAMVGAPLPAKFDAADAEGEGLDAAALDGWLRDALEAPAAKDQADEQAEAAEEAAGEAADKLALAAEAGDAGAPFEPAALATLRNLKAQDFAGWVRLRTRLKRAGVGVTELDKQLQHGDGAPPDDDESVADRLIALARNRCRFLHDAQREPYAVFEAAGARQVHGVLSSGFSDFLSHAYYTQHDRAPTESALKVALATLRGQAQFEGDLCEAFVRVAKTDAGYWLDLCNDAWQCVQVTATGWAVVAGEAAPLFTRSASMRPLPVPERGGTLDALWPLVNVPEADRLMVLTWMLECLRADTPHVVLELVGEQGSAKSSTQRALRRLIDPNQADLRAAPKSVEDVWIAARNSHMVSLENLSHLHPPYQDALCVLATGGGYSARTLYTNAEETILELRKPIVLNGISVIVTAQDLLDRCLHIDLPTIKSRELAGGIEARFEAAQPALLGALLDLFVKVLATLPTVSIAPEDRPRMADFAALGEAVFRVHGEPAGAFLTHYNAMRKDGVLRTIDASPVGAALAAYLADAPGGFNGTLAELLVRLDRYRPQGEAWPRTPKGLGDALRRLAPALRLIGFECKSLPKTGGVIRWHIFSKPQPADPSPARPASPAHPAPTTPRPAGSSATAGHAGLAGRGVGSQAPEKSMPPPEDDSDWLDAEGLT